jgi:hypothetical protein
MAFQLLTAWNAASINGPATITGIDYNFYQAIGLVVPGIKGRNVNFATSKDVVRYPSVVAITIRPQDQVTELSLDTANGDIDYFDRHTELTAGKKRPRR